MGIFLRSLFIFCFILTSTFGSASPLSRPLLSSEQSKNICETELTAPKFPNEFRILWLPSSGAYIVSHMDVEFEGTVWSGTRGFTDNQPWKTYERLPKSGARSIVAFTVDVDPAKLTDLKRYLDSLFDDKDANCSQVACKSYEIATGKHVPQYIKNLPVLSAIYLAASKTLGNKKIKKIEFLVPKNLSAFYSKETLGYVGPGIEIVISPFVAAFNKSERAGFISLGVGFLSAAILLSIWFTDEKDIERQSYFSVDAQKTKNPTPQSP